MLSVDVRNPVSAKYPVGKAFKFDPCYHDRAARLCDALTVYPSGLFWPVFHSAWLELDRIRPWSTNFLELMRQNGPARDFMADGNAAFHDDLGSTVKVYRGCSHTKGGGISWTTSREVAEGYARSYQSGLVPTAFLAEACIPKAAIFTAFTEREEDEVVLDPRRLRELNVKPFGKG